MSATSKYKKRFSRVALEWERRSFNMSSFSQMMRLQQFEEIMSMQPDLVVPLILERYNKDQWGFWFLALGRLVVNGPETKPHMIGHPRAIRHAWLSWGFKNGLIKRPKKA